MFVIQVSTSDEGRDMWQVYLDMKAYAVALSHCRNAFQRDQVYLVQVMFLFPEINVKYCSYISLHVNMFAAQSHVYAPASFPIHDDKLDVFLDLAMIKDFRYCIKHFPLQADAAFAAKEYYIAASFYAKVKSILLIVLFRRFSCQFLSCSLTSCSLVQMNYTLSFEEISLKFISVGEQVICSKLSDICKFLKAIFLENFYQSMGIVENFYKIYFLLMYFNYSAPRHIHVKY